MLRRHRQPVVGVLAIVLLFVALTLGSSGSGNTAAPVAPSGSATLSDGPGGIALGGGVPDRPSPPWASGDTATGTAMPSEGSPGASPAVTPRPTPRPTARPTPKPVPPRPLSACPIFPASNVWNRRVDSLPVAADSDAMISAIGLGAHLHPDFSAAGGYGIPYNVVSSSTAKARVSFEYASESDRVKYPIPPDPKIEGGSDRHLLMVDTSACTLYELYAARLTSSGWRAGSGAVWDLRSNALRPDGWTSADAAGLPVFPGLVRYDEVAAGAILHALRFTAPDTCAGHVYPARHDAGSGSCSLEPPMGLRVRLKADVDISGFGSQARVLLTALKRYGMILADNGSPWYVTGAPSSHWNDDVLHALGGISGADFEVVDTTGLLNGG